MLCLLTNADKLYIYARGQKTIEEDPNHISLENLFNESFMNKYSSFNSFGEFLEKGNFQAKTHEDVNNIAGELFNRHVVRETDFSDWESMLAKTTMEYSGK